MIAHEPPHATTARMQNSIQNHTGIPADHTEKSGGELGGGQLGGQISSGGGTFTIAECSVDVSNNVPFDTLLSA